MKNNEKNSNKKIAGIYYFASLCFYLCLGSSNLCLGSVYLNKDKDRDSVNKNNKK